MKLSLTPKRQLVLYLCFLALFFFFALLVNFFVLRGGYTTSAARLTTVTTDILVFVMPVVATLLMVGGNPFAYVGLKEKTTIAVFLLTILVVIVQIPAMNAVVALNEMIPFPDAIVETEMKAKDTTDLLFGDYSWTDFVITFVVVGLIAPFTEEFLFRGFLTRLISRRFRAHATIWIVAAIFSFIHFQFLGFIPRMLLGALFGYMAWWSGTLWTAVLAHVVNNTLVIIASFIVHYYGNDELNTIGTQLSLVDVGFIVVSAVAFYFLLRLYRREALRPRRAYVNDATSE